MSRGGVPAMVEVESAKAMRQPATYVLGGILVAYGALIVLVLGTVLVAPQGTAGAAGLLAPLRHDAVGFVASILTSIATLLLVIFAAQSVGQEFARGTLRLLLLSGARRRDVPLAKLVFLAFAALVLAAFVAMASAAAVLVFAALAKEDLYNGGPQELALLLVRVFAALLAWGAIATGTTLATRSLGMGIGATVGGLVVGDVLRGLLAAMGSAGLWASRALPNAAIGALAPGGEIAASDWAWIAPNLLLWVVGLNAYAAWSLQRLDVIAATK